MTEENPIEKRIKELEIEVEEHRGQINAGQNHIEKHMKAAISKNGAITELRKLNKNG